MSVFDVSSTYTPYIGESSISQIDTTMSDPYEGAENLRAAITRAQWDDYKLRYQPILENLVDSVTGENAQMKRAQTIGNVSTAIDQAYTSAAGTRQRTADRFGLAVPQQGSNSTALDKARNKVNAINQTRRAIDDRNMSLASGIGTGSGVER